MSIESMMPFSLLYNLAEFSILFFSVSWQLDLEVWIDLDPLAKEGFIFFWE